MLYIMASDCPSASEVTLKDMVKIEQNLATRKHSKAQTMYIILWMNCKYFHLSIHIQLSKNIFNSLWPSIAIRQQGTESTLA